MELCGTQGSYQSFRTTSRALISKPSVAPSKQQAMKWASAQVVLMFTGRCEMTLYQREIMVRGQNAGSRCSSPACHPVGQRLRVVHAFRRPHCSRARMAWSPIRPAPPGLACLPTEASLDALFELKQRSADKPVSLGVLSLDQATSLVTVPEKVRALEAAFPTGVFTFILDAVEPLDPRLGGERVAVRCLAHPSVRSLRPSDPSRPPALTNPVKRY